MFTNNPFAALTEVLPANVMQVYVVLMVLAVVAGTLVRHRAQRAAPKYFSTVGGRSKSKGSRRRRRRPSMVSLAIKTGRGGCPGVRGILQRRAAGSPIC